MASRFGSTVELQLILGSIGQPGEPDYSTGAVLPSPRLLSLINHCQLVGRLDQLLTSFPSGPAVSSQRNIDVWVGQRDIPVERGLRAQGVMELASFMAEHGWMCVAEMGEEPSICPGFILGKPNPNRLCLPGLALDSQLTNFSPCVLKESAGDVVAQTYVGFALRGSRVFVHRSWLPRP